MKVVLKIQRHLAIFYNAEDDGAWFAVCCRRGAEILLGMRLLPGKEYLLDLNADMIKKEEEK